MKWLLGGFILWLAMKGRFGNYANLAAIKAAVTPSSSGASSATPAASSSSYGPTVTMPDGTSLAGEIELGGGSARAPGSALALPGMSQ